MNTCKNIKLIKQDYNTEETLEDLYKIGVYKIECICSNKSYIGSTTLNFHKRFSQHLRQLKKGKHKNKYLQRTWNKYGKNCFIFSIIEIVDCKNKVLSVEQKYLDSFNVKSNLFFNMNILASGTSGMSEETIIKRNASIKKRKKETSKYYKIFKKQKNLKNIPKKYHDEITAYNNHIPWNKGKKYKSTEHLKVPKTKTKAFLDARKKVGKNLINSLPKVFVYDLNFNYLGCWKNVHELEKESLDNDFILYKHMKITNKKGRNGYPPQILRTFNTQKSARTGCKYKGLYFKYAPADCEVSSKSDELSGSPLK